MSAPQSQQQSRLARRQLAQTHLSFHIRVTLGYLPKPTED